MNTEEKKQEKSAIKVNDRRRFTLEGELKEESNTEESEQKIESDHQVETPIDEIKENSKKDSKEAMQNNKQYSGLDNDFHSLLISLAASAQAALGLGNSPLGESAEKNLVQAKQAIDLLDMLERKTQGNLSREEDQILKALLYELRMLYINAEHEERK
ncbi:MAG: DUF1844 domain-containing protein [Deltaproteobacteria bacterium]|nr:DUF1844 domain-containing protein [Deltaproteobacteria bacterium]